MSKKINIDESIREKLDGFSAAPPPHVWDNIQVQMEGMQKKRRLAYVGWISAAAVVVLAFVAGWYFSGKTITEQPALVEQVNVPAEDENLNTQQKNTTELETNKLTTDLEVLIAESSEPSESDQTQNTFIATNFSEEGKSVIENGQTQQRNKQENYSLLQRIETIFTKELPEVVLKEQSQEIEVTMVTPADEVLIAENLRSMDMEKSVERGWIVGAQVSPGYSSHSASHNDDYSRNMTYDSNGGGSNVGGGISVQYKTSKGLRVESGIYYAKDGQKSNNSFRLFASENDLSYASGPEVNYDGSSPAFSNVVQTGNSGIAMNSTAGVIEMKSTPQGANIAANLENRDDASANMLYSDGEFSQVFEFIEVPLYLRYSILDKKLGVDLLGGINAGFVVGNNAYLDNDYGVQNIGSTADISTLNFSGTVGVGFNYMLGKHFSFALEPRMNYYLNSINSSSDVNYRPYRIGVYTGVYYEF